MENNIEQIGKRCTGCRVCEQVCPQKCITMQPNTEGFLYPLIDKDKCIHCGLCLKKCAQNEKYASSITPTEFNAFKNKNNAELFRSASGGVSDVAAKVVLMNGGVVFGAAYTDELEVKHIGISEDSDRPKLQSSKYVQSDTGDCYTQAKSYLETGRWVLFTGTPCQIDGLYHFLGKDYENLYTIDIICHGVPSPLFFKKYVEYMGKKMNGKLIEYNFRSKEKRGWGTQYLARTKTKTKTKTRILSLDKYGRHFMAGDCYRECCYQCQYADIHKRPGNLTIGDFWGVNKTHPEMSSELGVSSVVVNNGRGLQLIEIMRDYADIIPITKSDVLEKQGNLTRATKRPESRDTFY
ncbi:MAG: Coenzyme F420 hydrogenase/dehydrogenase, beta subunit C-terminal domain, partial [Lachnospiraceae bacterium]|nr:Coenzyme F420 hydrogenase/dehydrogenase, beta subunit C-terminal domain [Lachnospiraceae bacterium]